MDYLLIFHTGKKIFDITLTKGKHITVGNNETDNLKLDNLISGHLSFVSNGSGVHLFSRTPVIINGEEVTNRILSAGDYVNITEKITLAVFESCCDVKNEVSIAAFQEITIGRSIENDICLRDSQVSSFHAVIKRAGNDFLITDRQSRNGTFINKRLLSSNTANLNNGTEIFIGGFLLEFNNDRLKFKNTPEKVIFSDKIISAIIPSNNSAKSYPFFYRSPRIRATLSESEIEISPPPDGGNKPAVSWLSVLMPPSMMIMVMLLIVTITKNTMMLFYTLPMSGVSIIVAIVNYRSQMKKWRLTQELVKKKYAEHLTEKEKEIIISESSYITTLSTVNPGIRECLSIAKNINRRLWERTPNDSDFLSVRLGTGHEISNVNIKIPREQLVIEENPLLKDAGNLKEQHKILYGVPVCHSFLEMSITGLVGNRSEVQKTVWTIITGIATHHSYEDVKIVCVYPEHEKEKWEWIRWLPHVWNSEKTRRFIACTVEKARPMLRELAETLKVRRRESSDQKREGIPDLPFYFLVLADKTLVESSGELFLPESSLLGFSVLYAYGDIGSLPGECQTLIECGDIENKKQGFIQNTFDAENRNFFTPDYIKLDWVDNFARSLAPVRLRSSGVSAGMPTYVPFLKGLGVNRVEELNVLGRWEHGRPFKSIAAPIGIKENGETFYFDIHEKGMGPHGIAAGATRWGKSETLTTWLLSVALHYKPEEVSFVLIDFKGDGLSGILMDLPHVAGVISNVDDITSIERNLRSLRGELIRRQRVFKETKLENIHKYQETRRRNNNLKPMPYLIVVIDEFAELKTQFPEQMDEFISIARVGGSLGVYMVLATQSPGGIVAGQVSANSRFRICLKTAEAGESKEILGTTDAFRITVRGRAYIKVGNNEVYEQVQTFYSKAPYNPESGNKSVPTEINLIELNGERMRPETIYDKTVKAAGNDLGEGRAISSYIRAEAEKNNMPFATPVWTEALPKRLSLNELIAGKEAFKNGIWTECNNGLAIVAGRVDNPEEQCQYPLILDFMKDGHQILYGAPSSGKTTFLQTVLLSAALLYTPEQVQFLVFDFGNWGMKIFEDLPHVLMVADPNDKEKLDKAVSYLLNELNIRKKLFAEQGVGTLEAYRDVSGKLMPAILVAVDNMASLYNQNPDLMDSLIQLAREGGGLGIFLVLTAGNPGSFMFRIAQYVKSNHALQLTDRSDYRQLVGGTGRQEPGHFPGRGFTKGPLEFQTALCVDSPNEGERVKQLRDICLAMTESWHGERASLEEAENREIDVSELSFDKDGIQIGINKTSREPVEFVLSDMNGCIISGTKGSGKTNILGLIVRAVSEDADSSLFIYEENVFLENLCFAAKIAHNAKDADLIISELAEEFEQRRKSEINNEDYKRIIFCIDEFQDFYTGISQKSADILEVLARSGADYKIFIYMSCSQEGLARMHTFRVKSFEICLSNGNSIITGGNLKDYIAFEDFYRNENIKISEREACMIHNRKVVNFKTVRLEVA